MKKQFLSCLQQVCFYDYYCKVQPMVHHRLPSSVSPLCRYALFVKQSFTYTPGLISGFLRTTVCKSFVQITVSRDITVPFSYKS